MQRRVRSAGVLFDNIDVCLCVSPSRSGCHLLPGIQCGRNCAFGLVHGQLDIDQRKEGLRAEEKGHKYDELGDNRRGDYQSAPTDAPESGRVGMLHTGSMFFQ